MSWEYFQHVPRDKIDLIRCHALHLHETTEERQTYTGVKLLCNSHEPLNDTIQQG